MLRRSVVILVALMLVGIGVWIYFDRDNLARLTLFQDTPRSSTIAGITIGGPFTLSNQRGETVTEKSFDGQWRLMFFGFTHCPDVCPTKLTSLGTVMTKLGPQSAKIVPIFVRVDPERDTVPVMKDYVAAFDDRLVGLTGTPEQIQAMIGAFRIYAQKAFPKDQRDSKEYNVDHSAFTYLMGPHNEFLDVLAYDLTPQQMVERIQPYLAR